MRETKTLTLDLSVVGDLVRFVEVTDAPAQFRAFYEVRLERITESLCQRAEQDACILEGLALLPVQHRRRFLRAPHVAARLFDAEEDGRHLDAAQIAQALCAELASAGLCNELSCPVWTARGERLLSPDCPAGWTAPEVCLGESPVVVDDRSPYTFPYDEDGFECLVLPDETERVVTRDKLLTALAMLAAASPPAYQFVTGLLDVIAVRREPGKPRTFHSSSFSRYVGLMLLTNAHLPNLDTAAIVDTLIHESVHSLLFMYERSERRFLRTPEASRIRMISPWSRAQVSLAAYLHACVVWYALYQFWRSAAQTNVFPTERCLALERRARGGFLRSPVSEGLAPHRDLLTLEALSLLEAVEARMRSDVAQSCA